MLEHRRGREPKTERAERASFRRASLTYQPNLRENSRVAFLTGKLFLWTESTMTNELNNKAEDWKYSKEAMNWYGWGSPVGLSLGFAVTVLSVGGFIALLHVAGVIR